MLKTMSLAQKGVLIVAVLLTFQIVLFGMLSSLHTEVVKEERSLEHSTRFGTASSILMIHALKVSTDAFHLKDGRKPSFEQLTEDRARLEDLKRDMTIDKRILVDELDKDLSELVALTQTISAATRKNVFRGATEMDLKAKLLKTTTAAVEKSRQLQELVGRDKTLTIESLGRQRANRQQTELVLQIALAFEVLLAAGAIWWFKTDIEKRIGTIYQNTFLLAQGKPLLPEVSGTDDIAQLDNIFHKMADALEKANRDRRTMVDHAKDAICQFDENFTIATVNPASSSVLGRLPDKLIGSNLTEIVFKDDVLPVVERLKDHMSGTAQPQLDVRVMSDDGTTIDTLWSVRWSNSDRSFFCVMHDNRQKKQAERLRQDVLQMVNHDLRTPLFTVSTFLEMGQAGFLSALPEKAKCEVDAALSRTTEMLVLIEDLLDLEKVNAGMLELSREDVSIQQLFEQAIDTVNEYLIGIEIKVIGENRVAISVDVACMQQVLVKLLTSMAVHTSCERGNSPILESASKPDAVEIIVRHPGVNIPESVFLTMFDPYADSSEYLAQHARNSRMMLAVCRRLVELHGGSLTAQSVDGACQFQIRLPVA